MSQKANVELMAALTGLTHDVFIGKVVNNVRRDSPTAMLFQDAEPGEYRLEGQNMVYSLDLNFKTGGVASDGNLPDHVPLDSVQGKLTPVRRYSRLAIDNMVEKRASGPGAFDDLSDRIFDKLWDAWASMEIRHAVGSSSGLVAKCSSRSSSTVVVLKDGYGNAGTEPLSHLSEGSILTWYDVDLAQVGGAARITSTGINYTTKAVTLDSAATWETAVGNVIAANDLIYFATTNDTTAARFTSERNLAPNGLGTIVDPNADATTVFNISETTYRRHKPFRQASTTFDHLELTEHWLQLSQKRGFAVRPQTDVCITFPSNVAQIARSLMGYQQQQYTGDKLEGGYQMVGVSGIGLVEDNFFFHDVAMTIAKDYFYRIPLGGQADFWGEDGSMWSRIADYDGKDAYVVDYLNCFSNHRGASAALTGISTDLTDSNWSSVPSY